MILSLIYFLPCVVSLLWMVSLSFKMKTDQQRQYMIALLFSTFFYALYGIYVYPTVDYETMVRLEPICIPAGILFPVYMLSTLHIHRTGRPFGSRTMFALLAPPVALAAIVNILCYIIGFDTAAQVSRAFASTGGFAALPGELNNELTRTYCFCTYNLFVGMGGLGALLVLTECVRIHLNEKYRLGDVLRFFFKGKETSQSRAFAFLVLCEVVLMIPVMLLGSRLLVLHPALGLSLTVLVAAAKHCASHVEFYGRKGAAVTLYGLSHLSGAESDAAETAAGGTEGVSTGVSGVTGEQSDGENARETAGGEEAWETIREEDTEVADRPASSPDRKPRPKTDMVASRFLELMEKEKLYLQEDLTASTICERLGVGRTTLSTALNAHFDQPLRDIINRYRIEEAMRYMLANPTATQEVVAIECGFKNAQYLSTVFKKMVGQTPAMWHAGQNVSKA